MSNFHERKARYDILEKVLQRRFPDMGVSMNNNDLRWNLLLNLITTLQEELPGIQDIDPKLSNIKVYKQYPSLNIYTYLNKNTIKTSEVMTLSDGQLHAFNLIIAPLAFKLLQTETKTDFRVLLIEIVYLTDPLAISSLLQQINQYLKTSLSSIPEEIIKIEQSMDKSIVQLKLETNNPDQALQVLTDITGINDPIAIVNAAIELLEYTNPSS